MTFVAGTQHLYLTVSVANVENMALAWERRAAAEECARRAARAQLFAHRCRQMAAAMRGELSKPKANRAHE
jgi:hypothetical protein